MTLLGVGVGGGNVVGLQVTAEADGEFVTRAEDLDAGVPQPQGIGDRRGPEVGEGGRSRAQKCGGRVGDDLVDEAGAQEGGREGRASFEQDMADLALGECGQDGVRVVVGQEEVVGVGEHPGGGRQAPGADDDAQRLEVGRRGLCAQEAARLNRPWLLAVTRGRPMVTWKLAATLDGRIAAADGTSQWITPVAARHDAHRLRRQCDAIMVGTGTALADDPALTVRDEAGQPAPAHLQPLRVVVGSRSLPATSRVLADDHYLLLPDHDPRAVLAVLAEREIRHVLLEGGPTLATAFLRAGLVDQVVAYTAPALLGAGAAALADFGAATISDALRLSHPRVEVLGAGDELAVRFCGDLEADDVPTAHFHTEESH